MLSSERSANSDINYKPVVKFIARLGVAVYLYVSENLSLWTDTSECIVYIECEGRLYIYRPLLFRQKFF